LATKAFLTEAQFVLSGVEKYLQNLDGTCLEQVGPNLVVDHIGPFRLVLKERIKNECKKRDFSEDKNMVV